MLCGWAVLMRLPPPLPDRDWSRFLLIPAVALLFVSGFKIVWNQTFDPLRQLTASQSRTLYQSNLDNFTRSCTSLAEPAPEVVTMCRQEAALLRRLPDCDEACGQLTSSFATEPTR
jgi:hypothetical protein